MVGAAPARRSCRRPSWKSLMPRSSWTASGSAMSGLARATCNNLTPALDGLTLYAADAKGRVVALERETGKEKWEVKLKEPLSARLALAWSGAGRYPGWAGDYPG
ncbi:PQQ-binding-like beta-propeller repeat protein [Halopseudomonas pachastrellae]|nr:PQQ-binding-like beta-propeller repeat protein [Halopseudomonas pachastrellae]